MSLKVEAWFPQLIWSGLLDNTKNEDLVKFAYERKEADEGVKNSNYIGWQSGSIHYNDNETFDRLVEAITGQDAEMYFDEQLSILGEIKQTLKKTLANEHST